MSNRIKVVGYAQKVTYADGIEYRNFSPDLVGFQLASDGTTPLFTLGNFAITTNLDPKISKTFTTSSFSNFITLSDLKVSLTEAQKLLTDNATAILNLDKGNLDYYSLFGSLSEFMRVSLENVIINWPASIYLNPVSQNNVGQTVVGFTVEDYNYDSLSEISSFKINTSFIVNKFKINYTKNGSVINTFSETNDLRNMTINYESYAILYNNTEYPLLAFSASTYETNDYLYLNVKGNPFSGVSQNQYLTYHIKPSQINVDKFFNELPDFEYYLLNRSVVPLYTATFNYALKSELGVILYTKESVTWPVSDGYNIDFDTTAYEDYATNLFNIANNNDLVSSNLMNRFLVSESISAFDTAPVRLSDLDQDTSGQKVNKTLQIYGREYDELNKYILGIKFANTVTYNKQDNTPDLYLKNLARILGWELVSSVFDNDLLASYVTPKSSTYSGESVGLTPVEADIELWRRIILNSPWLWKSKGARKAIEFLIRFIGAPLGLIQFNEYVYKADGPIDIELFREVLKLNGLEDDISLYPIDPDGYPRFLPDNVNMYFQNNGLWYRETGGTGATIDILTGNNPHVGPYDGGYKYFNQLRCLIPDFVPVTLSSETSTTFTTNLYTNYDVGDFNFGVTTATTVDTVQITSENNIDLGDCVVFTPSIIKDPNPSPDLNDCGCETPNEDNVMSLCINEKRIDERFCDSSLFRANISNNVAYVFSYTQYNKDGSVFKDGNGNPILYETPYTSTGCCKNVYGGTPWYYEAIPNDVVKNNGYVCCKPNNTSVTGGTNTNSTCGCFIACSWVPEKTPYTDNSGMYIKFKKPDGKFTLVTPDGCNCISTYSTPIPNITDPFTGQIGYACKLNQAGVKDLQSSLSNIYTYYLNKSTNFLGGNKNICFQKYTQISATNTILTSGLTQNII